MKSWERRKPFEPGYVPRGMIKISREDWEKVKDLATHHSNDRPEVHMINNVPQWLFEKYGRVDTDKYMMIVEVEDEERRGL